MANDKNVGPNPKKGFPGGFLLLILSIGLIIYAMQTLTSDKYAKVSFAHQVEHLVNLDFLHPESNSKIAQNDNLVTFSGKFREEETQQSKDRFKYLELLKKNHDLTSESSNLLSQLDILQNEVINSATWFLQITGIDIPKRGYFVVGPRYDTANRNNSIVLSDSVSKQSINLHDLKKYYSQIKKTPTEVGISQLQIDLNTLISLFKSSKLGIGTETIKQQLKSLDNRINTIAKGDLSKDKISICNDVIIGIEAVVSSLDKDEDNVRLLGLRSVRNYIEILAQSNVIYQELEKNQALLSKSRQNVSNIIWFFNNKELSTRSLEKQDPELFNHWFIDAKKEQTNFIENKGLSFKAPDQERNTVLEKTFKSHEPAPNYFSYIFTILPIVLVVVVLYFIFSKQMKGVGSSAMSFGKSPARLLTKETNKVTFNDVAGAEESKEELTEIVDFLKDPQKYTSLGARIPKGVLLVGPPGTGKTLIAKAVAGEADRPFYSISGSDFVEMFVGVGASRVRDLFDQGKKNAPCIIFMDEIDAVGRQRGSGMGGGHDEREQTLNQLLVEMDGFDTKEGVILMAATNRPDILDKALLRPGRFDRRVILDLPDVKGRYEILKVHAKKIKMDDSVNLMAIAKVTPGSSGADLENILNEAALLAAKNGRSAVTSIEAIEACDKVRFGKERRSLEMDDKEKLSTSYHESGHAIVGLTVKNADPVDKVTIIPRGFSLGATHFMPKKNRLGYWKKEIIDQLAICMGGRAAEEIFSNDMSSGAQQDINQATSLARSMICEWGMSEELGTVTYDEKSSSNQYLGGGFSERLYSEETARKIDKEVYNVIEDAHKRALEIVSNNKERVELMSNMLMEFETLDSEDIKDIMEDKWDEEKKRNKLKVAENLKIKRPPPPPPKLDKEEPIKESDTTQETDSQNT